MGGDDDCAALAALMGGGGGRRGGGQRGGGVWRQKQVRWIFKSCWAYSVHNLQRKLIRTDFVQLPAAVTKYRNREKTN